MIETDILIIGAGPAGSILSKYLARSGKKNILVQRNLNFKKPCGGGLRIDAFDEFDIDTALISKRVNSIALVSKSKHIKVDVSQTPLSIVKRVEFDAALRLDAQRAGSTLYEATFISVEVFDTHLISTLKKDNQLIKIKSNFLVGADGVHSKVRKLIYGDTVCANLTSYADIATKSYESCEFHFGSEISDQYYAWAFPHHSGSNIGTLADNNPQAMKSLFKHLNIDNNAKTYGYKIPHFKNNIFYKDRVFFVGDSASQVLPFVYEGIYYAMSSAKILADVLIEGASPQEYEKRWNVKYLKKFTSILKLQKIFLKNDFMIGIMMRLYENKNVQKQMIQFWLGNREVEINLKFFVKVIKKVLRFT